MRRSRAIAVGVRGGVRRGRRLDEQQAPAEPAADLEHRLRDVHLVRVHATVETFEIAQRLQSGDGEAAVAHGAHAGVDAGRMPDDVARRDHHLREARVPHRGELALQRARQRRGVHPEVVEDHRGAAAPAGASCTSSNITLPSEAVVRAPRSLAWTFSETRNSTPRFCRSSTVASTSGVPKPMRCRCSSAGANRASVVGLDQLEVERAAGAFEQQPLGQDAEALAVRQRRKAEDLRVELDPVRGAVGIDVLDDPEEVHPAERGRMGVDRGNGAEIDVVDREFVVPVDEIDEALADAVNRGDVELHRPRPHGDLPRAELERPAERGVGIADADRERADDGALGRLHRARDVRRLRVHDDVHLALAIELDLAGAMARDRPESHPFEHAAQRLRLGRGEFDEFDAVDAEEVVRLRDRFAIQ